MNGVVHALETAAADLRYAVRILRRSPGFAAIAILSLALGIGAATVMFSVVHAVAIDPFPYRDPDTLMSIVARGPNHSGLGSYFETDAFLDVAEHTHIFDGVIASTISDVTWTGAGDPERLRGNFITTNTFDVMGVPPLVGRAIGGTDGRPDAPPVVVLGYRFWQRRFGGDSRVIGLAMRLNGTVRTVVGVMPRRFMWRGADVYVPVVFHRGQLIDDVRAVHLLGRLRPGVTDAQADADLRPVLTDIWKRDPPVPATFTIQLVSFKESFRSDLAETLWVLLAAVGLLLLIACANVSNLLLARASAREREIAVRAALGAGRWRIARQLLTEGLVIALAGGVLGVACARIGLAAVMAIIPPNTIPDESHVRLSLPVLLFALGICLISTLVVGMLPAIQAARRDVVTPLKEARAGSRQGQARSVLVVLEVALSVVLLVAAAMMVRSLSRLVQLDLGVPAEQILTLRIPLAERRYPTVERRAQFITAVLERVRAIPGVASATTSSALPVYGGFGSLIEIAGAPSPDRRGAVIFETTAEYSRLANLRLVSGRYLETSDVVAARHVGVVNETFVRRYVGDRQALGRRVKLAYLATPPVNAADDSVEIVGVVADRLNAGMRSEGPRPEVHIPFTMSASRTFLLVRAAVPPAQIQEQVRRQVYAVDPDQPVTDVRTLAATFDEYTLSGARFSLVLFGLFATMGLTMAMIGVYGVLSYSVARQTPEIGVRLALGASRADILRMVLTTGLRLLAIGMVLGVAAGYGAARVITSQVWGATAIDGVVLSGVIAVLSLVGLQACLWPALRATRVNPMIALRAE
jgi:putative ABC transport system permease protein